METGTHKGKRDKRKKMCGETEQQQTPAREDPTHVPPAHATRRSASDRQAATQRGGSRGGMRTPSVAAAAPNGRRLCACTTHCCLLGGARRAWRPSRRPAPTRAVTPRQGTRLPVRGAPTVPIHRPAPSASHGASASGESPTATSGRPTVHDGPSGRDGGRSAAVAAGAAAAAAAAAAWRRRREEARLLTGSHQRGD